MWWAQLLNNLTAILSGSKTFQPTDIANCKVWLDASDTSTITLNGSGVSQWTDKTTNAYTFTQGTAANQPTSGTQTINSRNVIVFDGTNDSLANTAASSTWNFMHNATGYTAFMAFRYLTPSSVVNIYWQTDGAYSGYIGSSGYDSPTIFTTRVTRGVTPGSNATADGSAGSSFTNATNYYISTIVDPANATASNRIKIRVNGGAESKTNTLTNAYSTANATNTLTFGTDGAGTYAKTWIGEFIMYTGQLSATDVATVNSYLATKWAI